MTNFKRKLLAVAITCFVSAGAFAQKGKGGDKQRPPKDNSPKVVVQPKENPPQNKNQGDKRGGKKGRG